MQKAKIRIEINDHIIEGIGTKSDELLSVETNEEYLEFDLNKMVLSKSNKDLVLKLDFLNQKVYYELTAERKKFSNNFKVFSLTNTDKQVIINYQIEHTDFLLKINCETI